MKKIEAPDGYTSSYDPVRFYTFCEPEGRDFLKFEPDFRNESTKIDVEKPGSDTGAPLPDATLSVLDA